MSGYADGNIIIDTKIDTSGAEKGATNLEKTLKELTITIKEIGTEVNKSINALNNSLKSAEKNANSVSKAMDNTAKTAKSNANAMQEQAQAVEDSSKKAVESAEAVKDAQNNTKSANVTKDMVAAQKEVEKLNKRLFDMYERRDKMEATGVNPNTKQFKNLEYDIDTVSRKLDQAIAKRDELAAANGMQYVGEIGEDGRFEAMARQTGEVAEKEEELVSVTSYLKTMFSNTGNAIMHPTQALTTLGGKLADTALKARDLAVQLGKLTGKGLLYGIGASITKIGGKPLAMIKNLAGSITGLGKESTKAGNSCALGFDNMGRSMKRGIVTLLKYTLGIRSLFVLFNRLRHAIVSGVNNIVRYSNAANQSVSSMASSLNYLRNSLGSAFAPILSVVAPQISALIDMLADAINYIGMFFAKLTGQSTYVRAKKVQTDYAASLGGTASSAKDAADGTKKLADATKDANEEADKYLSSLDEINKFQEDDKDKDKDKSPSGGGGSGGGGGGGAGDLFETVEIPNEIGDWVEKFKEAWANADFTEFGKIVAEKVNTGLEYVLEHEEQIMDTSQRIAKSIATFLNGFVENLNWDELGQVVGVGINSAFLGIDTFLEEFHFESLGKGITTGLQSAFNKIDWSLVTRFLTDAVSNGLDFVGGLIQGIDWKSLPSDIFHAVQEALNGINWDNLSFSAGFLLGALTRAILDLGEGIAKLGKDIIDGILDGGADYIKSIPGKIKEIITNFIEGFKKGFQTHSPSKHPDILELGANIMEGILNGMVDGIKKIPQFIADHIKALGSKAFDKIGEITIDAKAKFTSWSDSLKDKVVAFKAKLTTWGEALKDKVVSFKAKFTTWADSLKDKVIGGFKSKLTKFSNDIAEKNRVLGGFKAKITSFTDAIKSKVISGFKAITGKKKADGGSYYGGKWHDIPQYASGGSPSGTLFWAGEAGPEIVGSANGRTEVLNKSQIASAIYSATYRAMLNAVNAANFSVNALSALPPNTMIKVDTTDVNKRLDDILALLTMIVAKYDGNMTTTNNGRQQIVHVQSKDRTLFEIIIEQGKIYLQQTGRNPFQLV